MVPTLGKHLQFYLVLVFDLEFFAVVFVCERSFEAVACLLANLHNLVKVVLGLAPFTSIFINLSHFIEGVEAIFDTVNV